LISDARHPAGPARNRILDAIRSDPGVHRSHLAETLGLSWGTVGYHIKRLQSDQLISQLPHRGRTVFFDAGLDIDEALRLSSLKDAASITVARSLQTHHAAQIHALVAELGLSRKVVRRVLEDLQGRGMVGREDGLRGKFFWVADDLAQHSSDEVIFSKSRE
jgi:predicted transcriptional regulator